MPAVPSVLLAWATFPDIECARRIARALVLEKLVACVNLLPMVESLYTWKEEIEVTSEVGAWLKTTPDRYPELERRYRELHPYELPALVAVSVEAGLPEYLLWVTKSCELPTGTRVS